MQPRPEQSYEVACEHCGMRYSYDQERRCWQCDAASCPDCMPPGPEPLCPECLRRILPEHVEPMLGVLADMPEDQEGWAFEYKWDGVRVICFWDGAHITLESRNMLDVTARYPELCDLGAALGERGVILDGEVIALDAAGRPSFRLLQRRMHLADQRRIREAARRTPIRYMVFDVLFVGGKRTMDLPYSKRRELLEGLHLQHRYCQVSPSHVGQGREMLEVAHAERLEGLMAKSLGSTYQSGRRSTDWRKIKIVSQQDFVVGGWRTDSPGAGRVGSLLLGYYDEDQRLRHAGNAGTGFTEFDRRTVYSQLRGLERPTSPFADEVSGQGDPLRDPETRRRGRVPQVA